MSGDTYQGPTDAQRLLIDTCLQRGVPFWWRSPGTLLISGAGARDIINRVESSGQKVIGLEGFELESAVIHPRLDLIYDASISPGGAAAAATEWGEEIWIDITLGTPRQSDPD